MDIIGRRTVWQIQVHDLIDGDETILASGPIAWDDDTIHAAAYALAVATFEVEGVPITVAEYEGQASLADWDVQDLIPYAPKAGA